MEGVDGTSINTSHLACTWRAKVKGKESIKEKGEYKRERMKGEKEIKKSRGKYFNNQEPIL